MQCHATNLFENAFLAYRVARRMGKKKKEKIKQI